MLVIWIVIIIMNIYGFGLMGKDKRLAAKKRWRVRESKLFLVALLGGSIGIWAGMKLYRHKTQHRSFLVGIPLLFILNLIILVWVAYKF